MFAAYATTFFSLTAADLICPRLALPRFVLDVWVYYELGRVPGALMTVAERYFFDYVIQEKIESYINNVVAREWISA